MARYNVHLTDRALYDTRMLVSYMRDVCQAPMTAHKYMVELKQRIAWLNDNAHMFMVVPELTLQYGMEIRRINYKNTAVLYSMIGNDVYIQRIMPAANVWY